MTITARYPSHCACCHSPISVGEQIEWARGRPARHARCPETSSAPAASTSSASEAPAAPAPARRRSNSRAASCDRCGTHVPAGAGVLSRCLGSSSGCFRHFDDEGGWHVYCADAAACASHREAAAAERAEQATRSAAREAAIAAVRDAIQTVDHHDDSLAGFGSTDCLRLSVIDRLHVHADRAIWHQSCSGDTYTWSAPLTDSLRAAITALRPLL